MSILPIIKWCVKLNSDSAVNNGPTVQTGHTTQDTLVSFMHTSESPMMPGDELTYKIIILKFTCFTLNTVSNIFFSFANCLCTQTFWTNLLEHGNHGFSTVQVARSCGGISFSIF